MEVDYIIVGQGLSGSFLSWNLIKAGKKVLVINDVQPFTASKVASGVINPVTGRRIVSTWMIDVLLPFALEAYTHIGNDIGVELISQKNIIDFHPTPQMKLAFAERQPVEDKYLRYPADEPGLKQYFNFNFGAGEINPCYLIDVHLLLSGWRQKLIENGSLWEEVFDLSQLITPHSPLTTHNSQLITHNSPLTTHHSPLTTYKNVSAQKIIFCDGTKGFDSPYFNLLPYAKNKGEAAIVEITDCHEPTSLNKD